MESVLRSDTGDCAKGSVAQGPIECWKGWDSLAPFYYEMRRDDGEHRLLDKAKLGERPHLLELLSGIDLAGKHVLDAGCGFGYYAVIMAERGAEVVGIDFAPRMIELAREFASGKQRLAFEVGDVHDLSRFATGTFDLVFSAMDLEVPDVRPVFAEFARVLKPSGTFVFSVPHPIIQHGKWVRDAAGGRQHYGLDDYFARGRYDYCNPLWTDESGTPVVFQRFRRPLQDYTEALAGAGFVLLRLLEGEPSASTHAENPDAFEAMRRAPVFLIVRAQKLPIEAP